MIRDYPIGAIEGLVWLKFMMAMVLMVFARSGQVVGISLL